MTPSGQPQASNREAEGTGEDVERGSTTPPVSEGATQGIDQEKPGDAKYLVDTLDAEDDPKQSSTARKWLAVIVISSGSVCATCASSIVCVDNIYVTRTH